MRWIFGQYKNIGGSLWSRNCCWGVIASLFLASAEGNQDALSFMRFETEGASLTVDLRGGSLVEYRLRGSNHNPLMWDSAGGFSARSTKPRAKGHFICLDRWGSVSTAEKANGMTKHGEASSVLWKVTQAPALEGRAYRGSMSAELPIAGLRIERDVSLSVEGGLFYVEERVTNLNQTGRIYNLVQHPCIGGPFLDEKTRIDCNGGLGFAQGTVAKRSWEQASSSWPYAVSSSGERIDIRFLAGDADPPVTTFLVEDRLGWITATSPSSGLLLGYLWSAESMPWIHFWRKQIAGKPFVRGLEFGTAGLHQAGRELVEQGKIFGRKIFRYIDAGEVCRFSYICFLVEIPEGFSGVSSVSVESPNIIISGSDREENQVELLLSRLPEGASASLLPFKL